MKSDEQIARELQEEEFKEVAIQDRSNNPPQIPENPSPAPYYDNHAGFQPMPQTQPVYSNVPQQPYYQPGPSVVLETIPLNPKFQRIIAYSRTTRWIAILDAILCFIYILTGLFVLVLLIFLPILGYFGGARLLKPLLIAYMIYEILVTILRIALIAMANNIIYTILTVLTIIFTISIFVFLVKFYRMLNDITPLERLEILTIMRGPLQARQPDLNNPPVVYGVPANYQQYQGQPNNYPQYQPQPAQPFQPGQQPYMTGPGYRLGN